ncbi:MAG: F0F1 ATP synthase subunit A [Bacteroidetes bacterium]|nr:F0F1 ATP synthase subunit A [Bacteroidota bacterium]
MHQKSRFRTYNKNIFTIIVLILITFSVSQSVKANEEKSKSKKFNAGEMIIEHIADAHEWHIMTIGETHISIPLPVILIFDGKLSMFCSSRFHHGTESYNGFKIAEEGKHKGKIVHILANANGQEVEDEKLPLDFSITKMVLSLFIGVFLLGLIFLSISHSYRKRGVAAPKGLQSLLEPIIIFVRDDIAKSSIGEKKYQKYLPFLLTIFFFIFLNNLMGLIPFFPGGVNLTGNIAITLTLAVFTFLITTFSGNRAYWVHIVNAPGVPWWLKIPIPLMPIVELVGVFTKPFVLMVRLFANITAGHIIALGFVSLIFIFGEMKPALGYGVSVVSVIFYVFMGLLELLVAFIQAYVFTLLSALYFGMAIEEHHKEENH